MAYTVRNMWTDYKDWLLDRVHFDKNGYEKLMDDLHERDFTWKLDRDDNRAEDGMFLRDEFFYENYLRNASFDRGCSVLEMLVALSMRIDNEYIGDPEDPHPEMIFWEMIENLGLGGCTDRRYDSYYVNDRLTIWMERKFDYDGNQSIFPLKKAVRDQTEAEIWSQMNEYLSENY